MGYRRDRKAVEKVVHDVGGDDQALLVVRCDANGLGDVAHWIGGRLQSALIDGVIGDMETEQGLRNYKAVVHYFMGADEVPSREDLRDTDKRAAPRSIPGKLASLGQACRGTTPRTL